MKEVKDDYGVVIKPGDVVEFSCGAPPVHVSANVVEIKGALFALIGSGTAAPIPLLGGSSNVRRRIVNEQTRRPQRS